MRPTGTWVGGGDEEVGEEGGGGYVFNIHLSLSSCTNHEKAFNCLQSVQMRSLQLLEYEKNKL